MIVARRNEFLRELFIMVQTIKQDMISVSPGCDIQDNDIKTFLERFDLSKECVDFSPVAFPTYAMRFLSVQTRVLSPILKKRTFLSPIGYSPSHLNLYFLRLQFISSRLAVKLSTYLRHLPNLITICCLTKSGLTQKFYHSRW